VPSFSSISPGTPVSIVLKVDQPTGREVQGMVEEVLTRGDHPRGVKVKLRDGRVGRVQRLVGEEDGREGEEHEAQNEQPEPSEWSQEERRSVPELKSEMVKCPVCGIFEGDAKAVAWHVEGHF
ncbi:hypothetical protein P154DRAFT_382197, partial [Amniculicola lignicola CBS 123094]